MEDAKKKKPFDPYPPETEKGNELVADDEEELTPSESTEEDEELEEEFGDEVVEKQARERIPAPEELEEEVEEELEATVLPQSPRSWSLFGIVSIAVLVFVDMLVLLVGTQWFWTSQATYVYSLIARMLVIGILLGIARYRIFAFDRRTIMVVTGWIGLLSGIILACLRFSARPALWTFLNLIVEPVDSLLLALGTAYLITHTFKKILLTKQSV